MDKDPLGELLALIQKAMAHEGEMYDLHPRKKDAVRRHNALYAALATAENLVREMMRG